MILGIGIILITLIYLLRPRKTKVIIDLEESVPLEARPAARALEAAPALFAPLADTALEATPSEYLPPYEQPGFGIDIHRNNDKYGLEDYLELPLVGSGETYSTKYANINTEDVEHIQKYKYIRFTVLKTRNSDTVNCIIHFYSNKKITEINTWNPYTGERAPYTTTNDMSIIFYLTEPIHLTKYEMETFGLFENDPVEWIIEGSTNATYWVELDSQTYNFPRSRGRITTFEI